MSLTSLAAVISLWTFAPSSGATADQITAAVSVMATPPDTVAQLVARVKKLNGEFRHQQGGNRFEFNGDTTMFVALESFGKKAVHQLIGCLGDETKSRVTVARRAVLTGVLCYEALMRIVYVEPSAVGGFQWPGYLKPQSTGAALRRAAAAWKIAEARRQYSIM